MDSALVCCFLQGFIAPREDPTYSLATAEEGLLSLSRDVDQLPEEVGAAFLIPSICGEIF